MGADFAELELILDRNLEGTYTLGMHFRSAGSDTDWPLPAFKIGSKPKTLSNHWGYGDHTNYEQELREWLFSSEKARTFFQVSLGMAQAVGSPLRIQVIIEPAKSADEPATTELHDIAWEVLRDPLSGRALATTENIWLSRYVISQDRRPILLSPDHQLQAVVMASSPSDISTYDGLKPFDAQTEIARVLALLKNAKITAQSLPDINKKCYATLNNLISTIREKKANLVYLVCHGKIGKNGKTFLYLEDDDGKTAPVYGKCFADGLAELSHLPQLVVLASCESAGKELSETAKALGPMLAEIGVPAVLAMHGQITQGTIKRFMPAFFSELQRDGQIDRALSAARGQIKDCSDVWMPVLFLRSKSGKLWKEKTTKFPRNPDDQPFREEPELNPADDMAAALLATWNQQKEVIVNEEQYRFESILRSFPIDQCSSKYVRALWEKRREIGYEGLQRRDWQFFSSVPSSDQSSEFFFDPFINERAEVEKPWLFCKNGSLFWAHSLFEHLNTDSVPLSLVIGERGSGKTALALALGQYKHSSQTLGVYLKYAPQLPQIYQDFASRLLEFIQLHPTHLVYLAPEELRLLAQLLSTYLGQAPLLSSLSRAYFPENWRWLQEASDIEKRRLWQIEGQTQLRLLIREVEKVSNNPLPLSEWPIALYHLTQAFRFETIRLIVDTNIQCSPSWLEEVIFKPYQTWTQAHCQIVLFLHPETANQWKKWIEEDFPIYPLSWEAQNHNLLKSMILNRWEIRNQNKDITMAIKIELLEQLLVDAKGNPGKFILLWKEQINAKNNRGINEIKF